MNWLKNRWAEFEIWVSTWLPGLKTRLTLAFGAIGSAALALQDEISKLPLGELISAKSLAIANIGLMVVAYWFSNMSARVKQKAIIAEANLEAAKEEVKATKKAKAKRPPKGN